MCRQLKQEETLGQTLKAEGEINKILVGCGSVAQLK
jgi:hypothetical protein